MSNARVPSEPAAPPPQSSPPTGRSLTTLESLQSAGPSGGREWHNFTGTPRDIWRLKSLAQGASESGIDVAGKTIPLKYWYLQEVQIYDRESNEYRASVRTVLMRPDLTCVSFVSVGMVKAIQSMCEAIGLGPYDPPIDVMIDQQRTRSGNNVYTLVPIE